MIDHAYSFTWIRKHSKTTVLSNHFRITQVIFTIGLVLSIVGGVNLRDTTSPCTLSQVAIIVYFVGLAACVFFEVLVWVRLAACSLVPASEHRAVYVVAASLPLIFTRILFSALALFVHDSRFNIVRASTGVYVGMVVVEELLVVITFTAIGWQLDIID